jgi:hypothetical protein
MARAEEILAAVQDAHGWRDMLWTIILDDLESRDPSAAAAARAAIRAEQTRADANPELHAPGRVALPNKGLAVCDVASTREQV